MNNQKTFLAPGTIQYIYRVLNNILQRETDWQLIKFNGIVGVKQPKIDHLECDFYDENDAKEIIVTLYDEPRKWRLLILGAKIGGFRLCRLGPVRSIRCPLGQ